MVSVAGDAERASSPDPDVVRVRGVRRALPMLGGCRHAEGGIRAPAKGTSPDLGRGYIRTRSRLSRVVAAMRNSFVGENGKRTENRRKTGGTTDRTTRFLPRPLPRIPACGSEVS